MDSSSAATKELSSSSKDTLPSSSRHSRQDVQRDTNENRYCADDSEEHHDEHVSNGQLVGRGRVVCLQDDDAERRRDQEQRRASNAEEQEGSLFRD